MLARLPFDLPVDWNPYRGLVPTLTGQEGRVELTVLAVPGCPNVPVLQQRLAEVLADWPGVTLQWRVIAEAGSAPALACRMYRAEDGSLDGAPSVAALRQALEQAIAA
jgi:hypothetical protein